MRVVGEVGLELYEGVRQRIYSPPPLPFGTFPPARAFGARPENGARLIVSSSPERNDRKHRRERGFSPALHARRGPARGHGDRDGAVWLWGWHAVAAALENPAREAPARLLATPDRARELEARRLKLLAVEVLPAALIGRELPSGAAHQGVVRKARRSSPRRWRRSRRRRAA